MSQVKAYIPEIAVMVGINAAVLLNHIKYWVETQKVEKMYRTNEQISSDFKGSLSESQVQRAKKKLIEAGLVIVSHDKGHLRTTHYKLTEKAKGLLGMIASVVKKAASKAKSVASTGTEKAKRHIPDDVREKLAGLFKKKEEKVVPEPIFVDNENDNGDEDYFAAIDFGMAQVQAEQTEQLSFAEVMAKAFSQVPNVKQLEKNRADLEQARTFKEDF